MAASCSTSRPCVVSRGGPIAATWSPQVPLSAHAGSDFQGPQGSSSAQSRGAQRYSRCSQLADAERSSVGQRRLRSFRAIIGLPADAINAERSALLTAAHDGSAERRAFGGADCRSVESGYSDRSAAKMPKNAGPPQSAVVAGHVAFRFAACISARESSASRSSRLMSKLSCISSRAASMSARCRPASGAGVGR